MCLGKIKHDLVVGHAASSSTGNGPDQLQDCEVVLHGMSPQDETPIAARIALQR